MASDTKHYDYVIVGAGSAGCVHANKLSKNPDVSVLLLEAGPRDSSLKLHVPAAVIYNDTNPRHNWMYYTEPDLFMEDPRLFCPRGKVLDTLESVLAEAPHFMGEQRTLLDYLLVMHAVWPEAYPTSIGHYPNLRRLVKTITARPAVQRVITVHEQRRDDIIWPLENRSE